MCKPCPVAAIVAAVTLCAAGAQGQTSRPPTAVEVNTGYAAFADEAPVEHFAIGGAPRFYVSKRVSLGPEFIYMVGPGEDRDFFLTGNVWFDFVRPPDSGVNRLTPYFVAGAGVMFHRNFLHNEGVKWFAREPGFSFGFGLRVAVNERWYVAPEARLGSEIHARLTAAIGYQFKR
jgi:hypothetical protein